MPRLSGAVRSDLVGLSAVGYSIKMPARYSIETGVFPRKRYRGISP